jgi:uncharacterized protein (DUF433 family)
MAESDEPLMRPGPPGCHTGVVVTVLDREMYTEVEAARLLQVPQSTLHYWLEGGERRGRTYRPIIRMGPTRRRIVTWAEFLEAGWLRAYRKQHVSMAELRLFIDHLRKVFEVPYPLADRRPLVSGQQLVYEAQKATGLDGEYWLVAEGARGQLLLTGPGYDFIERVEWSHGDAVASAYRPDADPRSPVRIDPEMRFGRPAIKGISTQSVWEHVEAGEDATSVAETFGLTVADVRWALSYENRQRAA